MSKKTLNQTNLEALGAEQLAALLMEVSTGSADIKRRLRLELSHHLGAAELAHEVRKRLASLRKSNSFIGWRKRKALVKDLTTQAAMITDKIAPDDPTIAFELLWQFIELAPSIYGRVDDSNGDVSDVFLDAKMHFEDIAPRAIIDTNDLADKVWSALQDNGHGEWDGIITLIAPALGTAGLARLRDTIEASDARPAQDGTEDHEAIQFLRQLRGGTNYAAKRQARLIKTSLQEIAAFTGDTGAYISQYSEEDLRNKETAAQVAQLLLADGRVEDALDVLRSADYDASRLEQESWDSAYITALLAAGHPDEAQSHRWESFLATLNAEHLRNYLKVLPDFEDVEAEERAKDHALGFPEVHTALQFCLNWPDLLSASKLIQTRADEINGGYGTRLSAACEALRGRYPLAAMLLLRAMIDHVLDQGLSSKYAQAAEHLSDCTTLDGEISEYAEWPTHHEYVQTLKSRHERRLSFWSKVRQ